MRKSEWQRGPGGLLPLVFTATAGVEPALAPVVFFQT